MKSKCNKGILPFIYNNIANKNLNPGYKIEQFQEDQFVAVKFNIHAINFRFKITIEDILQYNFCFWSIYIIDKSKAIFIPSKQKKDPDKQIVLFSRMRKLVVKAKLAQYSIIILV